VNATLPDDERDRTEDVTSHGSHRQDDHRQDNLLGWPLGALLVVALVAVVAVVVTGDAFMSMLMAGIGGVVVVALDQLSD
jgi:cytochrome b